MTKKLQEIVIGYLVKHYADHESKEELSKQFNEIDKDKDGIITKEDLMREFEP